MNITVTGRHMEMTDAIRDHVERGLDKVRGHFDEVIDAGVILSVEKHRRIAEINLLVNGLRINAKESSDDMYVSVDAAVNKVYRQVRKHKSRIQRHQPRAAHTARDYGHQVVEVPAFEDDGDHDAVDEHRVVHREQIALVTLSTKEALLQLELQEQPFLLYLDACSHKINVVYARDDGKYGLIDPQI